ncbi:UNVERIFIED_CONTAM: hypothetical protein Slati_4207100 [Sesamum latifolium]|uniref:Uncharacterized protein n=1 Tax=Sesamum latifolium TaxID=2727402 RepID=A0AAW2TB97_9LAMI
MHRESRPIMLPASAVSSLLGVEHLEGVILNEVEVGLVHRVEARLVHGVVGLVHSMGFVHEVELGHVHEVELGLVHWVVGLVH